MPDKQSNNYQAIHYHGANYKFTIWGIEYIHTQFHREVEVWLLLHGSLIANIDGQRYTFHKGDFCIIDSFKVHELKAAPGDEIPLLLVMHVHSTFFAEYFPMATSITFPLEIYNLSNMDREVYVELIREFLRMGIEYFKKEPYFQLRVAGMLNLFYARMLSSVKHETISEESKQAATIKTAKLKRLTDYIYDNYSEKLLLSDLAEQEGISMSRLSHLFKECFNKSFQNFVLRVRCEKAKELLRYSDMNLLDIAMTCGFSDPKYFNQGFKKTYGCSPKEYRKNHDLARQISLGSNNDTSVNATVKSGAFLTDEDCFLILEYCENSLLDVIEHVEK